MILHGDCLDVMATLDADSVDAIVTDPPYGLSFMGKSWDHGIPGPSFWSAALRVAKPGAHFVAFGGSRTYHRLACAIEDAGWEVRDCLMWLYGSGFPKSLNLRGEQQGWGTALKPAYEPIILARKPLAGTVAGNVLAHGTGALNIDGCRIAMSDHDRDAARVPQREKHGYGSFRDGVGRNGKQFEPAITGRWPANVVLDEAAAVLLDVHTGALTSGKGENGGARPGGFQNVGAPKGDPRMCGPVYGDTGGASRFFYTGKASRADRTEGNTHPTVKPTDLMRWLVRLVCPPGGLVLDPFAGSGTTGVACAQEGMRFVGIEREAEYVEIARRRIGATAPLFEHAVTA